MCKTNDIVFQDPNQIAKEIFLNSLAEEFIDNLNENAIYVLGEGEETNAIKEKMGKSGKSITLIVRGKLIKPDLSVNGLDGDVSRDGVFFVVCPNNDGTIFSDFCEELIGADKNNIIILSTPIKIQNWQGKSLKANTGNKELDNQLSGFYKILTSYNRKVIYKIS